MIPFKDENPTRRFPVVTVVLIAVNIGVFLFVNRSLGEEISNRTAYRYAAIPCELVTGRPLTNTEVAAAATGSEESCDTFASDDVPTFPAKQVFVAVFSSMFLHVGLLHLAGNMLFLWVFGNNIEDRMGHLRYLLFYLLAGVVATAAHVLVQPSSLIPIVGASGAIAGVMGAYLVLFPDVPIRSLVLIFIRDVPAKWLLVFWFVLQFFTGDADGVAWVAHVGGFLFGALVAYAFRDQLRAPPPSRYPA